MTEKSFSISELPDNIKTLLSSEGANSKVYLHSGSFGENGEADPMELYTIRTEDSDTGTGKLIIHSSPVKYIDEDGNLQYIDTGIKTLSAAKDSKSEFAYENVANGFTVRFANTANKGINFNNAFTFETKSSSAVKTTARIGAEKGNGKIIYPNAFGTDTVIEYINTEGGIKENIILNKYTGQNRFEFVFRSETHIPVLENNGANIIVVKKDDPKAVEYRFLSLYAYDSYVPENDAAAEAETLRHMNEDLYYELAENSDGSYTIAVVVPNEYLTHPDIVYPVTIDPSMTYISFDDRAQDTFVDASTPSTQNNGSLDYIRFGKKGGYKHYGFQRFTSLPNLPAGANITNAYIRFTFRNGQNTPTASSGIKMTSRVISSAQWYESSVTWNNKPTGSTTKTSSFVYNGSYLNYFDVNLTNELINWYSGISSNYGICFTYYQEDHSDYNSVASCEGSSDRSPKLVINYVLTGLSTGDVFYIRNAHSGLYLTASGDSSGDNLVQSPLDASKYDEQRFRLLYLAQKGDYWLYPMNATDLAVQIEGSSSSNDANIEIGSQPSVAGTHQRFKIVEDSNGAFELLTRQSNYTKAISVYNEGVSSGTRIVQHTANGANSSKWYIERAIDVDAGRKATLVGVTASNPHDHETALTDISPDIREIGYVPSIRKGSFSQATMTYLLENSEVFVIRGHGEALSGGGAQLILNNDTSSPVYYRSDTYVANLDLTNLELVVFITCHSGEGGEYADNLVSAAIEAGARTAVGFDGTILCGNANDWTRAFFKKLSEGCTVQEACNAIKSDFSGTPLAEPVICGDKNLSFN